MTQQLPCRLLRSTTLLFQCTDNDDYIPCLLIKVKAIEYLILCKCHHYRNTKLSCASCEATAVQKEELISNWIQCIFCTEEISFFLSFYCQLTVVLTEVQVQPGSLLGINTLCLSPDFAFSLSCCYNDIYKTEMPIKRRKKQWPIHQRSLGWALTDSVSTDMLCVGADIKVVWNITSVITATQAVNQLGRGVGGVVGSTSTHFWCVI